MTEVQTNSTEPGLTGLFLTFVLDGGHYGVPILSVREIIAMHAITELPRLPDYVKGVINLRGKIIPVIDLRLRFGLQAPPHDRSTCIVVLDVELTDGSMTNVGCIVDTVSEVADINGDDIQAPPSMGDGVKLDSIQGLAKCDGGKRVVSLIDVNVVLAQLVEDPDMRRMTEEADV